MASSREIISSILFGDDPRLLLIAGPYSIHDTDAGLLGDGFYIGCMLIAVGFAARDAYFMNGSSRPLRAQRSVNRLR